MDTQLSGIKILLVSDDKDEPARIRDFLSAAAYSDFNLEWVSDFSSGLKILSVGRYDVCIVERCLRNSDGLDCIREAASKNAAIPIIVLIDENRLDIGLKAIQKGASDFLVKGQFDSAGLEKTIRCVIERKQLYQSEARFRLIFENSMDGIMLTCSDGRIFTANPEACKILGYTEDEICRLGRYGIADETHPNLPKLMSERRSTGKCRGELNLIRKDGSNIPVELSSSIFNEPHGKERNILIFRDISEQKRTEEKLRASEMLTRRQLTEMEFIYKSAHVGLCVFDRDLRFVRMNDRLAQINGLTVEQHLGKTPREVLPDLAEEMEKLAGWVFRTGKPVFDLETTGFTPSQPNVKRHWVEHWLPFQDDSGNINGISVVVHEITERKRMEQALRESEERFRALVEASSDALFCMSPHWNEIRRLHRQNFALDTGAINRYLLLEYIHPDDQERIIAAVEKAIGNKCKFELEYRIRIPDGSFRWILARAVPLLGTDGEISEWFGLATDISERMRVEEALQKANEELEIRVKERTQELEEKNRALQDFAFIISHDLQEPLRKIQVFGSLLRSAYGNVLDDGGRDYLLRMENSAARMQNLILDLLRYNRLTEKGGPFTVVDLKRTLEETVMDLSELIEITGGAVEIGDLPAIDANPTLMGQLFQNLVSNALKYHGEKQPRVKVYCPANAKHICKIIVEDNGIGFEAKHADLIFKPFRRLHGIDKYEGTGMGLAICRKIVERHGGSITAKGKPGKGSVFMIHLPVQQGKREITTNR